MFGGRPHPRPFATKGGGASCPWASRVGAVVKWCADAQAFVSPLAQAPTGSGKGPPAGIFGDMKWGTVGGYGGAGGQGEAMKGRLGGLG